MKSILMHKKSEKLKKDAKYANLKTIYGKYSLVIIYMKKIHNVKNILCFLNNARVLWVKRTNKESENRKKEEIKKEKIEEIWKTS